MTLQEQCGFCDRGQLTIDRVTLIEGREDYRCVWLICDNCGHSPRPRPIDFRIEVGRTIEP